MSTTLMPLDPALSPQRLNRILTISADLLPDEIVAARRARRSRGWVIVALAVVVAMLAGWYIGADRAVDDANDDLSSVTAQATALQKSQAKYDEVVTAQNDMNTISRQLTSLLGDDLPYARLLDTLRNTGSSAGVGVLTVSAVLNDDEEPSTTGTAYIGTVTITGTAPDKPSIARYVDALTKLTLVANPYPTNATKSDDNEWQYTIQTDITATSRCGRFTTKCASGGK